MYSYSMAKSAKTRSVMEGHSYAGVYRVTDYGHPFDSYAGEEVLLLDEYVGPVYRRTLWIRRNNAP